MYSMRSSFQHREVRVSNAVCLCSFIVTESLIELQTEKLENILSGRTSGKHVLDLSNFRIKIKAKDILAFHYDDWLVISKCELNPDGTSLSPVIIPEWTFQVSKARSTRCLHGLALIFFASCLAFRVMQKKMSLRRTGKGILLLVASKRE